MRRIQRDASHEDFIKSLVSGDNALFKDIWRVLLFAAAYGVKHGQRKPLVKVQSNKAMPENYFSTPGWRGFLYLLGFAETESSDHLKNDEDQQNILISTFEEYANYGLSNLSEQVTSSQDPLGDIIQVILEEINQPVSAPIVDDLI
jgi:dnd system-associated protein 4